MFLIFSIISEQILPFLDDKSASAMPKTIIRTNYLSFIDENICQKMLQIFI